MNGLYQFWYLGIRNMKNLVRDPRTSFAQLGQSLFLALLIGSLYFQISDNANAINDRFGVIFFHLHQSSFWWFSLSHQIPGTKGSLSKGKGSRGLHRTALLSESIINGAAWTYSVSIYSVHDCVLDGWAQCEWLKVYDLLYGNDTASHDSDQSVCSDRSPRADP